MRFSLPSPALVIACLALLLAAGGVSYAATGSAVNIADPVAAANVAKVDSAGKLYVGDGSGAMTVDGTVSARPVAPSSPWHVSHQFGSGSANPLFVLGPTTSAIDITAVSVGWGALCCSGTGELVVDAYHVAPSDTMCSEQSFDGILWDSGTVSSSSMPAIATFPTPLQYRPPANTKGCLELIDTTGSSIDANLSGFYG